MIERGYLYCVTCLPTGKLYFGQTTVNVKRRWHQHIRFAVQSRDDYKLHAAIRKYGVENFTVEEVMWVEAPTKQALKAKLDFLEIHFIQKFDTRRNGYNMTDGGDWVNLGSLSEEHKRKLSESKKGDKIQCLVRNILRKLAGRCQNQIKESIQFRKSTEGNFRKQTKGKGTIISENLHGIGECLFRKNSERKFLKR